MTELVLPDMRQFMNQPDFVGDAGLSEIIWTVFAWEIYISIGAIAVLGLGRKGMPRYILMRLKSMPSAKTCFAIRISFSVSLRQLEKIIF
ncbi:hypothetical protein [Neisseria subflava]|uniref:hypothetical protein n=1 Tax=Neisseria subflava TaxID=28449 RepID=UPI00202A9397|nr:hypothetical protein [Neisseria subflava]